MTYSMAVIKVSTDAMAELHDGSLQSACHRHSTAHAINPFLLLAVSSLRTEINNRVKHQCVDTNTITEREGREIEFCLFWPQHILHTVLIKSTTVLVNSVMG